MSTGLNVAFPPPTAEQAAQARNVRAALDAVEDHNKYVKENVSPKYEFLNQDAYWKLDWEDIHRRAEAFATKLVGNLPGDYGRVGIIQRRVQLYLYEARLKKVREEGKPELVAIIKQVDGLFDKAFNLMETAQMRYRVHAGIIELELSTDSLADRVWRDKCKKP